jgi:hypothetical protein
MQKKRSQKKNKKRECDVRKIGSNRLLNYTIKMELILFINVANQRKSDYSFHDSDDSQGSKKSPECSDIVLIELLESDR